MAARKHQELIVAWAAGADIQYKQPHSGKWVDAPEPAWMADYEYRVKPPVLERVYPQTKMQGAELSSALYALPSAETFEAALTRLANEALRHACDAGQIVTREEFDRAVGDRKDNEDRLMDETIKEIQRIYKSGHFQLFGVSHKGVRDAARAAVEASK